MSNPLPTTGQADMTTEDLNVRTVDAGDYQVATEQAYSLAAGGFLIRLNPDAGSRGGARLTAAQARQLAADLVDQAYEADKRNGVEPQLDAAEFHAAAAAVQAYLNERLSRDDMIQPRVQTLAEIAADVTAVARGQA